MSEFLGYVVKAAPQGGWNKGHIWAVSDARASAMFRTLCNVGGRQSPRVHFVNHSWARGTVNSFGVKLEPNTHPLDGWDIYCRHCARKWAELLRNKELGLE